MLKSDAYEALVELSSRIGPAGPSWSAELKSDVAQVQLLITFKVVVRDLTEWSDKGQKYIDRSSPYANTPLMELIRDKNGVMIKTKELIDKADALLKELPKELLALIDPVAKKYAEHVGKQIVQSNQIELHTVKARLDELQTEYKEMQELCERDKTHFGISQIAEETASPSLHTPTCIACASAARHVPVRATRLLTACNGRRTLIDEN